MKFEQDILKAQIASQLSQEASIEGTDLNILIKSFEENLIGSYDRDMFMKSWSSDLAKRFPSGGWRKINGASVFINNGKVVAGLGGFNGMIDDYFSAKEKEEKIPVSKDGLYQIYTVNVKNRDGGIDKMYGVPSPSNKGQKGFGDDLLHTLSDAIKTSEYNRHQEEVINKRNAERDLQKQKEAEEKQAKIERNKGKTKLEIMNEAKDAKILDVKMNYNGVIQTRREHAESIINGGGHTETKEVNKVKDVSRATYNRMDGRQQEDLERRIREGGKKTEYRLYTKEGTFYDVTKAEYDYAKQVESRKQSDQPKEEEKKEDKPKKEEKAKLSPRAKQVLKDSQRTFDQSSSLRQIELYDLVKKNIGIDKNGKEKIGMGLDEDMVAAGNEFLKKNEKAYNEAKELIQSRKDFKKEESKQKATKDVSNIEKIALQQNKEMEDKIKSVSSSASVKEKLEVVKQINSKIDSLSKESLYNSKTNQYNTKMVDNMIDVLQNIDEKYLSKEQKNEMDDIKESLDTLVSIDKDIPAEKGKKSKYEHDYFLKEHDSLGDKLKALNERLKYESDDKGDYDPQKHGSLSSFEEEVENVQKFLGNIKKDYVSKQATELLNYKLF